MRNIHRCVLLLLVVATDSSGLEKQVSEPEHAGVSFFQATETNVEAMRQGDVLVRIRKEHDAAKEDNGEIRGAILYSEEWIRLAFDYDRKIVGCYRSQKDTLTNFSRPQDSGEPSESEQNSWSGIVVDFGKDEFKSDSSDSRIRKGKASVEFKKKSSNASSLLRDFRGLWLQGNCRGDSHLRAKKKVSVFSANPDKFEFVRNDGQTTVTLKTKLVADKAYDSVRRFRFDNQSLMLLSVKCTLNLLESDRPTSQVSTLDDWRLEWEEINELFVPSVFSSKGGGSIRFAELGEPVLGSLKTEMNFHWFSVNKTIERNLLDGSQVDFQDIQKLLDPFENGADSIVSDVPK